MKERDCWVKACRDGECGYCKRMRGERRGAEVLRMCADRGILPELQAEAERIVGTAIMEIRGQK